LMLSGRRASREKISQLKNRPKSTRIWFHCASLGEFEQARPVIEQLRDQRPTWSVCITFFSPSGYEVRKDYKLAEGVFYLPFDTKSNARNFVQDLSPDLAVFVKYEFWYHILDVLKATGIPVFSISAIFRPQQPFFKFYGELHRRMLRCFDTIYVQDEESLQLLEQIGVQQAVVAGDTRFDRVAAIAVGVREIALARKFGEGRRVVVIGSSWPEDIDLLSGLINDEQLDLAYIIAPHEISEHNLRQIELAIDGDTVRYSQADKDTVGVVKALVIDNIGMLSSLYQYGYVAFVGGSFGDGLHNVLEPATFGIPVIFGKSKSNSKYREAIDLLESGAGFEVKDTEVLVDLMKQLVDDEQFYEKAAKEAREYVGRKTGATKRIVRDILKKIS